MSWELVEVNVYVSALAKLCFLFHLYAAFYLIYSVFNSVLDSRKMKRQLKSWLERGEQPLQPPIISAEAWAAMFPIKWENLPACEQLFAFWVRPQLDFSRKVKAWAVFSIIVGLIGTIFELMQSFLDVGILGYHKLVFISTRIAHSLPPLFIAAVLGMFFYLLAIWADARVTKWRNRMLDGLHKPVEMKTMLSKQ